MTTVAVCQSNYIPWKGYFDMIRRADYFVFYDTVQYTKNDWRNRNKILTQAGLQWLTVPVLHNFFGQSINQIELAGKSWQTKHWKSILQNYRKAPYFDCYAERIQSMYQQEWQYLSELNKSFIQLLCELLNIKTRLVNVESLEIGCGKNQRLLDICSYFNASTYLSGPAAKTYLDEELFLQNGLAVRWMQYDNYKPYKQCYQPFEHAVTVLDLLFNTGPDAPSFF